MCFNHLLKQQDTRSQKHLENTFHFQTIAGLFPEQLNQHCLEEEWNVSEFHGTFCLRNVTFNTLITIACPNTQKEVLGNNAVNCGGSKNRAFNIVYPHVHTYHDLE